MHCGSSWINKKAFGIISTKRSWRSHRRQRTKFDDTLQFSSQVYSCAASDDNSGCEGSDGQGMEEVRNNTSMAIGESKRARGRLLWKTQKRQKESPLCCIDGHQSSQECGARTNISELQRTSRTPRWHCKRRLWNFSRLVCVSNHCSRSNGYQCKTTWRWWTSSRRRISIRSSQNVGRSKIAHNSKVRQDVQFKLWIRFPRHKWPNSWSNIEHRVVRLERFFSDIRLLVSCGKEQQPRASKEEKPVWRGKWDNAVSGTQLDNVRKETHVISVMVERLETDAIRDEKRTIVFFLHQKRRHRSTKRNPQEVQASGEKVLLEQEAELGGDTSQGESVRIRRVFCGTLRVSITSLNRDAHVVTSVDSTLRLTGSPVKKSKITGGKGSVASLQESFPLGCVSQDSHPRKSMQRKEGNLGSDHAVSFSKGTWHHMNIRQRKGPSPDDIQKCELHERKPCAPRCEERT